MGGGQAQATTPRMLLRYANAMRAEIGCAGARPHERVHALTPWRARLPPARWPPCVIVMALVSLGAAPLRRTLLRTPREG
eukprot:428103-Rhodomonas_salina.3